jgi:hypothetical protein
VNPRDNRIEGQQKRDTAEARDRRSGGEEKQEQRWNESPINYYSLGPLRY